MQRYFISIRFLVFSTIFLGCIYPLSVLWLGKLFSPIRSQGSLIYLENKLRGSELIGQSFNQETYFWSRPSIAQYDPLRSSASQLSAISGEWKKEVENRKQKGARTLEMLHASGSGLDPHIGVESALLQMKRVAQARGIIEKDLRILIQRATDEPFLGFMGRPRVNVLELNMYLDQTYGKAHASR